MDTKATSDANQSQSDKFRAAARHIGCDEDEVRWTERLKRVVKVKPGPAKTET